MIFSFTDVASRTDFANLIGEFVPQQDEHWELFLIMMEIVDLLFFSYNIC